MKSRYSIIFFLSAIISFVPIARILALSIQQMSITKVIKSKYLDDIPSNSKYDWDNR